MLKHGFQHLWQSIIRQEKLKIEYNKDITSVRRDGSSTTRLCTKSLAHDSCEAFDFVVWTPELKASIDMFETVTEWNRNCV